MHRDGDPDLDQIESILDRALAGEPVEDALVRLPPELAARLRAVLPVYGARASRGGPGAAVRTIALRSDERFGRYRILAELGRGGQGVVYLADDPQGRRQVALKLLTGLGTVADHVLRRFQREAVLATRLDHPCICRVWDAGVEDGVPFLAMEHVRGETLARQLERLRAPGSGPTASAPASSAIAELLVRFEKIARGLHAAHEAGVLHRDIKPGNIMVTAAGEPVVLDFGLAQDLHGDVSTVTRSGEMLGTPAYMSPEQLTRQSIRLDRRTDVYSLGATLYECVALCSPFAAATREALYQAILAKEPRDPRALNGAVSRDLAVVIATAMAKDRDRRFQTGLDFAEDLRRVRAGERILARPASAGERVLRFARREPAKAALVGFVFLLAAMAGFMAARWGDMQRGRAAASDAAIEGLLETGYLELGEGQVPAALAAFRAALAAAPAMPEALGGMALAHVQGQDAAAALAILDGAAAQAVAPASLARVRVAVLRAAGRGDEATREEGALGAPRDALEYFLAASVELQSDAAPGHEGARRARGLLERAVLAANHARALYHFALAHAAGHAGDAEAARAVADVLERRWPESATAWHWAGFARSDFDSDGAVRDYQEALRLRPEFAGARYNLGCALRDKGDRAGAIAAWRETVRRRPEYADAWHNIAAVLREQGDLPAALSAAREAARVDPKTPKSHIDLGVMLRESHEPAAAVTAVREAIRLQSDNAEAWTELGMALDDQPDLDAAIAAYREAIRLQPSLARAHNGLGIALVRRADRAGAIEAFRAAIRLQPANVEAHVNLGRALAEHGDPDGAVEVLRAALRVRPDLPDVHLSLGTALALRGDMRAAVAAWNEVVRLCPDQADAFFNLGQAYVELEQIDAAIEAFAQAVRLRPDHAEAFVDLADALARRGRLREALAAIRRGHELGSSRPDWQLPTATWLATYTRRLATLEGRLEAVRQGRTPPPDRPEELLGLADLAQARGHCAVAARLWTRVLELSPELGADPRLDYAMRAARAAARAGCGDGEDAGSHDASERERWRAQALDLLEAHLARWRALVQEDQGQAERARTALRSWCADADLAGLRDPARLALLPQAEQERCRRLWAAIADWLGAPPGERR